MENKYRVWCNTEDNWVETWSDSEPVICPNGIEHILDSTNAVIIESIRKDDLRISFGGHNTYYYQCMSGEWELIRSFTFKGSNIIGNIQICELIASVNNVDYVGTYRLYDLTNNTIICTWSIDNLSFLSYKVSELYNIPSEEAIFEIHGKSADNNEEHFSRTTGFIMRYSGG